MQRILKTPLAWISMYLLLSFFTLESYAQKTPLTTDDGLSLVGLKGAKISPDGQKIIYAKSILNWKENKYETEYHLISAEGKTTYQFIGKSGASDLKFSPDGKYVSFRRKADKKQQLFLLPTAGGEAIALTQHKNSIGNYQWGANSQRIYFLSNRIKEKEAEKAYKSGYDHVLIDEGPNGQSSSAWTDLWQITIADKKAKALIQENIRISSFDVSGDDKQVVYIARSENRRNQGNLKEIYRYNTVTKSITRLTNNKAPESRVSWSPDGKNIVFLASDNKDWLLKEDKLWQLNPNTKNVILLSQNYEGTISRYFWTPDSRVILFSGRQQMNSNIYRLDVAQKVVSNISKQEGNISLYDCSMNRNRVVFAHGNFFTPNDLYVANVNDFTPLQLTQLNQPLLDKKQLVNAEVIEWNGKDGKKIDGLLVYPIGYKQGKKYPLLLHIHGGPAGAFTNRFRSQYQVWAGLGYVQLLPNVRGSSGYGDDMLSANSGDIGGMDYEDLMIGVDVLLEKGIADESKLAVRGWSYGGILGGTVVTKTNRFKAASLGAMVSDWRSEYGIGFNYDVRLWYIGGTPWENPEKYREMSSYTHIANVQTPVLLLHGEKDRTCTEIQSMLFFAALKDMGRTTRYIRFPREPHGFKEPRHQRVRDLEEIQWIQQHTLGINWKIPERAEDVKEVK